MQAPALSRTAAPAVVALGLLSLIWGYNFVVMKEVLAYADPLDFTAARTLLGALALFAYAAITRRAMPLPPWRLMVPVGLLQTALFSLLIQWALIGADAGRTVVVVYSMPFWLAGLAALLLGETLGRARLLAMALAGAGLLAILRPWEPGAISPSGLTLALLAGLVWALAAVILRRAPRGRGQTLLSLTAWQLLLGAVVLCVAALLRPSAPPRPDPYLAWALFYGSVLATGLAWALWLYILDSLTAAGAGFSTLLVPVVGLLASWFQLGERPDAFASLGIGLILAGLLAFGVVGWQRSR
ncbi:DMT family transporter [Pseudotabrizicola alkalilacus]|uniref:DMT family transporter n=1 Tax=Pseudotabrizicola alkalilacus TaxID=2305252 RepID=UPI0018F1EDBE|nr:EamA family transporter [Pseudotabrizicola alkalilacus]